MELKKPKRLGILAGLLLSLLLAGCAAVGEPVPTETPAPTPITTDTPAPTAVPTPTPLPFLSVCGKPCFVKAGSLNFSDREELTDAELREIAEKAPLFPRLKAVNLPDSEPTDAYIALTSELAAQGIDVVWRFSLYGVKVCSTDREINLTKCRVGDIGAAAEAAAEWMPHLEKIDMSHCGLRDELMDEIDKRHENVRFVWTVYFSAFSLRTDSTNFIAARTYNKEPISSRDMQILRYCPDLIALDLGHKEDIHDLSFLRYVPKLRYLILAECEIRDITPIGELSELEYLEIFWTKVEDPSPLLNCKKLLDLNICYIYTRADKAMEVLPQMTQLERLWYCGSGLSDEQKEELQKALPNCEMYLLPHAESTGGGWREHPRYFEMRDAFDMYYMPGGTNGVAEDGSQLITAG